MGPARTERIDLLACAAVAVVALWVLAANLRAESCALIDDAFISFQFARNLWQGHGLVWNAGGPPVEGASNLSLVALLALGHGAGVPMPALSHAIAVVALLASAVGAFVLARRLGAGLLPSAVAGAVLLAQPSSAYHAHSGLETHLMGALLLGFVIASSAITDQARAPGAHLARVVPLYLLLTLTRPEAGLLAGVALLALAAWARTRCPERFGVVLRVGIACFVVLLCVQGWKLAYFGTLSSPPSRIKGSLPSGALPGLSYVIAFVAAFAAPLLLALLGAHRARACGARVAAVAGVASTLTLFTFFTPLMAQHFRYPYPALALILALLAPALDRLLPERGWRRAAGALVALGLLVPHALVRPGTVQVELSRLLMRGAAPVCADSWTGRDAAIGRALATLGRGPGLRLALEDAGAMTYHSGATSLDLIGLVDAEVAGASSAGDFADAVFGFEPDAILVRGRADSDPHRFEERGPGGHGALGRFGFAAVATDRRFDDFTLVGLIDAGAAVYRWQLWARSARRADFERVVERAAP